jgi:hypothetical protein
MTSKAMIDAAASALHVTESGATARHPFPISIRQFCLVFFSFITFRHPTDFSIFSSRFDATELRLPPPPLTEAKTII